MNSSLPSLSLSKVYRMPKTWWKRMAASFRCAYCTQASLLRLNLSCCRGDAFTNSIFRSIILSMMATYGLWLYASIIFFEPWHMFTSFIQYILLAPTYINVINVYAFCNVHDVSCTFLAFVRAGPSSCRMLQGVRRVQRPSLSILV